MGLFSLPADVLIAPDGRIKDAHYGRYASDTSSAEDIVAHAKLENLSFCARARQ